MFNLKGKTVVLTGASGGIGSKLAVEFAKAGANLALVDRSTEALEKTQNACKACGVKVISIKADITKAADRDAVIKGATAWFGSIDVLINNAGVIIFKSIGKHTEADVLNTLMVNVQGTIMLTQAVLPGMMERGSGRIVNIGSTFGSLGFPYFSVYSASKSAIKGFSEALRRELSGTGVGVTYIAPRGAKSTQSGAFFEMAEKMKMNLDEPEVIAKEVVRAVSGEKREVFIGWPEKLFVAINKFAPGVIDKGLRKQAKIMAEYAGKT